MERSLKVIVLFASIFFMWGFWIFPFSLWQLPSQLEDKNSLMWGIERFKRSDGGKIYFLPQIEYTFKIGEKAYFYTAFDYRILQNAHFFEDTSGNGDVILGNYFASVWKGFSFFIGTSLPDTDDSKGLGTDTIDLFFWIFRDWKNKKDFIRLGIGGGIWGRSDLNNLPSLLNEDYLVLGRRELLYGPHTPRGRVNEASGQEDVIVYDFSWRHLINRNIYFIVGANGFFPGHFYREIKMYNMGLGKKWKNKKLELIYNHSEDNNQISLTFSRNWK